jgi:hypothetical protein
MTIYVLILYYEYREKIRKLVEFWKLWREWCGKFEENYRNKLEKEGVS